MVLDDIEPHRHKKTGNEVLVDILGQKYIQLKPGIILDKLIKQLKLKEPIKHHNKLFGVDKFRQLKEVNGSKLLVKIMVLNFPAHVTDGIGDGPGVLL